MKARRQETKARPQEAGGRRQQTGCGRVAPRMSRLLPAAGRLASAARRLPPAACRLAFVSCRLLPAACCLVLLLSGEILDRIAISVNNQVITEGQITEEIRLTAFLNQQKPEITSAEKKKAAERLIEQALVRRDMDLSHYPLPGLGDADASLKSEQARYATEAQYHQALQAYGVSEDGLKQRLWWQLTLVRFTDYRFRPGIQIPDTDLQAYYQQEVAKWRQQGVNPVPGFQDARDKIEEILTDQRIDQALDHWLADTRTQVAIRYHDEAFQ